MLDGASVGAQESEDIEHVIPLHGRTTSEHTFVKLSLGEVHRSSEPSTVVIASITSMDWNHGAGEIDLWAVCWRRCAFNKFLFAIPNDVFWRRALDCLVFEMKAPLCWFDGFPRV
jgi:hypothetical protein